LLRTPPRFKTFDQYSPDRQTVVSNKALDLLAPTYERKGALYSRLKQQINAVADYRASRDSRLTIKPEQIKGSPATYTHGQSAPRSCSDDPDPSRYGRSASQGRDYDGGVRGLMAERQGSVAVYQKGALALIAPVATLKVNPDEQGIWSSAQYVVIEGDCRLVRLRETMEAGRALRTVLLESPLLPP
jgi:hypothetical protein